MFAHDHPLAFDSMVPAAGDEEAAPKPLTGGPPELGRGGHKHRSGACGVRHAELNQKRLLWDLFVVSSGLAVVLFPKPAVVTQLLLRREEGGEE